MLVAVRAFDLGRMVIDGNGDTIYISAADGTNPPRSACFDSCLRTWKPVPATAVARLDGIDQRLVGTFTRTDSADQATLAGHPLYRNVNDTEPGQTSGMDAAGWSPVTPDGGKVTAVADPGRSDAFGL
ncbi:hypothetical protein FG385_08055 [Amycolatopsis alkalitolerans]|uniref:Uncharacterized protein n=2 Tax=Amycolatopsis alkalitolerans TaxID=2547244 RepID=A0A5C4M5B2_9PSEU|nr:hypothetical protein FG385_08055 [Amycolatopsis alkalitolerans]